MNLIKEYELEDVLVDRVDFVDEPCVPKAKFIIIKSKEDSFMEDIIKGLNETLCQLKKQLEDIEDGEEKENVQKFIDKLELVLSDKPLEEVAEVEKAGRKVSKATEEALAKIAEMLAKAVEAIDTLTGKMKSEDDKYKEPGKYPEVKKSLDDSQVTELKNNVVKSYDLYKSDTLTSEGMNAFIDKLFGLLLE